MSTSLLLIIGISIGFIATTIGALLVFAFKNEISPKINALILGFASGVMIAASIWSLLIPSIENAGDKFTKIPWLPASIGFIIGGLFLIILDKIIPHFHKGSGENEGINLNIKKSSRLFLAVTLHNIPEGLAVGFAFGAASLIGDWAAYMSALGLAIGIAIQNLPEGAAVALPMKTATKSKIKAFLYGTGSGVVEPIFALLGYLLASKIIFLQPWLLAFSAGAMIFVIAEDLIPDSKLIEHPHVGTIGLMLGFVIMMILDVALG